MNIWPAPQKLVASKLPASSAAQVAEFKRWARLHAEGESVSGFWAVCSDLLSGKVGAAPQTQHVMLEAIAAEGRFSGAESIPLVTSLAAFSKKAPSGLHAQILGAALPLLETRGSTKAMAIIATIVSRSDCPHTALTKFVNGFATLLGGAGRGNAYGEGVYAGTYETEAMRRDRFKPEIWARLWSVVAVLKSRRISVEALLSRMPKPAVRVSEVLSDVAEALLSKGKQSVLQVPSGQLSFHTSVDSDCLLNVRFNCKSLELFHAKETVLFSSRPVAKWGKPRPISFTGLFAADTRALDELFGLGFGSDEVQALVTGCWREGQLIAPAKLGLPKQKEAFFCLTDRQHQGAYVLGRDDTGKVAGLLVRTQGEFSFMNYSDL